VFCINWGLFKPLLMYFGLTNSPTTFQTMMYEIFADLITDSVVSVYMDDILIYTALLEEHCCISCIIMDQLRENKLDLCDEKCEFEKERIEYLGIIISHSKVKIDPVKVTGVAKWPLLTCKKEVQSFISFINFYHCFILNFSHHACALFDLTLKDVKFIWSSAQEDAFTQLKDLVISSPILILPNAD